MTNTLTLRADRSLIRAKSRSRRHLLVEFRAPEAPPREGRLSVNIAFVIDRSGSMHGAKLEYARQAVVQGICSLHESDRFAVVTYDDTVDVVVPAGPATAAARDAAVAAVKRIRHGGSTDLHGGWSKGCEQVVEALASDAVGRCLLLTDGLANHGIKDHDEIVRQCAGWRDRRVVTTTLGVGAGFDEDLLRRMADAGGGNFQFIESAAQIADFVASEVGEALATTVREGVLVVDAGEGAVVESLNGFPCRQEGGAWRIAIGSLFSGQAMTPVLRVTFPEGEVGQTRDVSVRAEDEDGALGHTTATARFTWASHEDNDKQPRDRVVDRQVAALYAARAEREALAHNRKGDFEGARKAIEACAARIRKYAGDDPELLKIVRDLMDKLQRLGSRMDALSSKRLYSASHASITGKPRRVRPTLEVEYLLGRVIQWLAAANPDLLNGLDVQLLPERLAHTDARGCLLDPTEDPAGALEVRLRAADLCLQCRAALEAQGVPPDRLQRIIEALRLLGAPSGVVH